MPMLTRFTSFLKDHQLVSPGATVLLAVSGGADSMALLRLFHLIKKEWSLRLVVAHINHQLRGDAADRDEAFVIRQARSLGIPIITFHADVKALARQNKLSIEDAARQVRFASLKQAAGQIGADRIALAHHLQDQAETLLMHLARGSGVRGLGGIKPMENRMIHPLLCFTRGEIEAWAGSEKIPFVTDETNADTQFLRNRIRHQILPPLIDCFGEEVLRQFGRSASILQETQDYIDRMTQEALSQVATHTEYGEIILDILPFLHYFIIIRKMIIQEIIRRYGYRTTFQELTRIMDLAIQGKPGARVDVRNSIRITKNADTLVFSRIKPAFRSYRTEVNKTCICEDFGILLNTRRVKDSSKIDVRNPDPNIEWIDADLIGETLEIRRWEPGDWFIPFGMNQKKKLHDFFIDEKISRSRRETIPIITSNESIVWIGGYRLDNRFRVQKHTSHVLQLMIQPNDQRGPDGK